MSNFVRSKRIAMFFAVVIILLVVPSAWADPIAMLTMQSQPGDYIGQGQSYNLTYTIRYCGPGDSNSRRQSGGN